MNKAKSTMKLFGLIGLLILWNCSCVDRHRSHALCEQSLIDSLEVRAQDSLFSNLPYSRSLLRNAMRQAQDSMSYYRLMGLYGKTFFISSDFDSILYYNRPVKEYDKRAAACPRWNDVLSDVYNIEGNVWMQLNQPDSAVAYYEKSYAYRLKGDKAHLLSDICMNLADAHLHRGELAHTASYYRRALFICDSLHLSEHSKFPVYCGLGQTYMDLRDFDLSNHYYELAGQFFDEMTVSEKWVYLNNRGNHYYYKKDYQEALVYMRQAAELIADYPQMVFESNLSKVNLGDLYLLTNRLDSAENNLNEGYRYFSEIKNNSAMHYIETLMIELSLKKGNIARAREMIARTASTGHVDANMLTIRNQYLQHYYEKAGDYRNAYEYLKRDYQLNDSIRSERIRTRVAELDMRYRQDTIVLRKEMQIQRQAGEVRVLKLSMYIWVLVCLLLAAGTVVIIWYMRKKREFLRERFFQQINRVRMENLRGRISPHFTFNVLGREINQFNGSEEVKNNLMELVKYLRRSLELTEKLSVSLQDELDFVQSYIRLESGRVSEDFTVSVVVEEGLDAKSIMIPSMIVQIPVENAIKHGLAGKDDEKELTIRISREGKGVRIVICDNGRGYLPQVASSTRGTGTGLKVLYQTIQLLNTKNKNEKIRFNIDNRNDGQTGTQVSVFIPFHFSYDL
ncbi:tetratricopeptide repeat-containing sensor histidine kinase [Bacteroides thetaiotaomicron]|jgi:tetratricopeptide (TPR) repeat protein|uniref:Histidine kinase n=3 Tax=Bacteroides thetaiotaomicron TaxID=818 RepID=A0AA46U8V5_BACT4|nr:histidine kinase [Bacteroides thetaiotaomicron]MCM1777174.1 histidine kinase [Bacteroides thetaiotaomicron]MCS2483387.1 histidine kinase [Bacteroides thetaiotaomicron]MCS2768934.1 histidine kinase [Bacteroides thetaiotaomicron]MCS3076085.1 histidine kinase [Bacteroides thetaiotaomicron]MCY6357403.1 histidine kinase [Bacteroides thetaiotaomicron]